MLLRIKYWLRPPPLHTYTDYKDAMVILRRAGVNTAMCDTAAWLIVYRATRYIQKQQTKVLNEYLGR